MISEKKQFELIKENQNIRLNNVELQQRIDKAIEYINKFDDIRAYYEYIDEDGYDEYNFDEDFKRYMLDIFKGDDKE